MVKFRTELICAPCDWKISADEKLLFIGSCFSDEIGRCLQERGFDVSANPLGPLYNPLSIATCLRRALTGADYEAGELHPGPRGYHCLDYATRFSGSNPLAIVTDVNSRLAGLRQRISSGAVVFITLGTSYIYELVETGRTVGNCHKFSAAMFNRRRIGVSEARASLAEIVSLLKDGGARRVVFTVSPIRHLSDGFHENTISKATLHLAVEALCGNVDGFVGYFPSYEIVMDDLRDYRAYADDLVHVSEKAVAYIYEKFEDCFFTAATRNEAAIAHKKYMASRHRSILE